MAAPGGTETARSSLRVLVASDQWFPDVRGGVARLATESAERLAALGHDVTALVPERDGGGDEWYQNGVRVLGTLHRTAVPQTLTDPRDTARAAGALEDKFDVALAHGSTTAAGLLWGRIRAPLVTLFHASAPLEQRVLHDRLQFGRERVAAYALRPILELLERRSLAGSAQVLVLSDFSRRLVADRHPDVLARTSRVPGAVDTDVFSPDGREAARARLDVADRELLVLTVRRLVPRMGLEELIEAAALLDVPGLRVAIGGSGPMAAALDARRLAAGHPGRIELLGRIPDEDLADWYRAADLVVVPTVAYEGFGLVTAEALACGTPVVGTPVGATPELLTPLERRLVARSPEPGALAEAIALGITLATPAMRERCRAHALERFSWAGAIRRWEAHLAAAASMPRAPSAARPLVGA
jgi:glycosyltransferase involved in cell wall biosynthesis